MFEFLTSLSLWGTIVNALGIIAGTVVGVVLKSFSHGKKEEELEGGLRKELTDVIMKGVSLCVLLIGITGAIKTENIMVVIVARIDIPPKFMVETAIVALIANTEAIIARTKYLIMAFALFFGLIISPQLKF